MRAGDWRRDGTAQVTEQGVADLRGKSPAERARTILDNWVLWSRKFVKVMPIEYRRALAEMAAKRAEEEKAKPKKQKAA